MEFKRRTLNDSSLSNKNIVIDPISGRPMLGKNLDKELNNISLKDRKDSNFESQDRVKEFLKFKRNNDESYGAVENPRLTRNFTASTTFGGIVKPQKTVESKPRNISSSFDDYSSSFHDRNLSTDGITGASPQKFKHMSKKLFVDRREVLSIFGGNPGRYHGFEKDLPVGGTYKDTTSKLWSENKSNDDNYVAGSRLNAKRGFQAKKKVSGIVDSQLFGYSDASNILNNNKTLIKRSPELKSSTYSRKFVNDQNEYKNETKLPYLKESVSNSFVDINSISPYKVIGGNSKRLAYK